MGRQLPGQQRQERSRILRRKRHLHLAGRRGDRALHGAACLQRSTGQVADIEPVDGNARPVIGKHRLDLAGLHAVTGQPADLEPRGDLFGEQRVIRLLAGDQPGHGARRVEIDLVAVEVDRQRRRLLLVERLALQPAVQLRRPDRQLQLLEALDLRGEVDRGGKAHGFELANGRIDRAGDPARQPRRLGRGNEQVAAERRRRAEHQPSLGLDLRAPGQDHHGALDIPAAAVGAHVERHVAQHRVAGNDRRQPQRRLARQVRDRDLARHGDQEIEPFAHRAGGIAAGLAARALVGQPVDVHLLTFRRQQEFGIGAGVELGLARHHVRVGNLA